MKFLKVSPRGFANEYTVFATTDKRAEEIEDEYMSDVNGYVVELTEREYRSYMRSLGFIGYNYEYKSVIGHAHDIARSWDEPVKAIEG